MVDMNPSAIVEFAAEQVLLLALAALTLAVCALIPLGIVTNRRRAWAMAAALGDSTRSVLRYIRPPGATGFAARFAPAPEPFAELSVEFIAANRFSPIDLMKHLLHNRTQELRFAGRLVSAPLNEILWSNLHLPARALGRSRTTELWVERRLDFIQGVYALRGANANAVDHAFSEMQGRFGAFTQSISVLDAPAGHVIVTLHTNGFNSEEVSALVAALRSLARAGLIA